MKKGIFKLLAKLNNSLAVVQKISKTLEALISASNLLTDDCKKIWNVSESKIIKDENSN